MKLWCVLHFQNSSVYRSILYSILFYRQQLQIAFGFSTLPPSYPNFIFIFYSNSNSNILDIYRLKDEKLEILIKTTNHYDSGEKWNFLYSLKWQCITLDLQKFSTCTIQPLLVADFDQFAHVFWESPNCLIMLSFYCMKVDYDS